MTSRRLSPEEVHAVGAAAAENAIDVMSDARILVEAGRSLRGYALAVTAVEELAKHLTCRDVLGGWTGTITVVDLNLLLQPKGDAHLARFVDVLVYLRMLTLSQPGPTIDELKAMAKIDVPIRERVLYVEVSDAGAPMTPADINEESSRDWVLAMADNFDVLSDAWRGSLADNLAEAQIKEASVTQTVTRRGPLQPGEGL